MATTPIVPQPTGNPILDNPTLRAALQQQMAQTQPQAQQGPPPMPPPGAAKPAPAIMGSQAPQLSAMRHPAPQEQAPPMQEHLGLPESPMPALGKSPVPQIMAPRGTVEGDEAKRAELLKNGSGISRIAHNIEGTQFGQNHPLLGKIGGIGLQGLATLGDIGLSLTGPGRIAEGMIPGTAGYHAAQLRNVSGELTQDEANREKEAQTVNLQSKPELAQAKNDLAQEKQNEIGTHHESQIDAQLRQHGFKHDEEGNIIPLPYEEMSEEQQGVHDLKASQDELAQATTALRKAQADPNSPQAKIAQQRLEGAQQARSIALQRLGLSEKVFDARYQGTDTHGQALPGAMLTDEGKPVGSSFSQNVRPTGQ